MAKDATAKGGKGPALDGDGKEGGWQGEGDVLKKNFSKILPLLLCQFSQAVQVMMLFPLLVFMVQFYGIAGDDPKELGKYTGILASMFPLTMFFTVSKEQPLNLSPFPLAASARSNRY